MSEGIGTMGNDVWVLGATGRTGGAIAARLHAQGVPLTLVGRDRGRLEATAAGLDGAPGLVAGPLAGALARLAGARPAVVVNTVGPFATTAAEVIPACPPGTHYVDVSNEMAAAEYTLDRHAQAVAAGQTLVTGAGFGVLGTESVVLRLCQDRPPAARVRADAIASVASEPGFLGAALAATIVEVLSYGGREVRHGRLVRSPLGASPTRLTTPGGDTVSTGGGASGELLAAWRASGAADVLAASNAAPASATLRLALPVLATLLRVPAVGRFATRRIAAVRTRAQERPRAYSWAHARAEWASGEVREGWLRAGDGMDFTAAVTAEVALRLARGEGRPGAFTPGALFGPALAEAAGAEFLIDDHHAPSTRG
ncbi:hypothetical protein [Dactylosporangium sp. CA-092794]|uniref:hypothetical protein n=1 Tax=Dactylosporangium sp. CA-092794 TaxID=3239929 RepID=UPI003D94944E